MPHFYRTNSIAEATLLYSFDDKFITQVHPWKWKHFFALTAKKCFKNFTGLVLNAKTLKSPHNWGLFCYSGQFEFDFVFDSAPTTANDRMFQNFNWPLAHGAYGHQRKYACQNQYFFIPSSPM